MKQKMLTENHSDLDATVQPRAEILSSDRNALTLLQTRLSGSCFSRSESLEYATDEKQHLFESLSEHYSGGSLYFTSLLSIWCKERNTLDAVKVQRHGGG